MHANSSCSAPAHAAITVRSDIDLAVFGMPEEQQTRFWCGMDDLPTLLKYDVVFVDDYTSPELLAEIDRDGVILYENQTR